MSDDLFDDEAIKAQVLAIWEEVFNASTSILEHAKRYGFLGMEMIPNPGIHEILGALKILESIFDELISFPELPYEEKRLILNAREQFTRIERVAVALKEGNRDDFEAAIQRVKNQAPF